MTKTTQEINDLKAGWKKDPCWDIEDTEGFEDIKTELLEYRLKAERDWTESERTRLEEKAGKLQCSIEIVKYVEWLEYKIDKLRQA